MQEIELKFQVPAAARDAVAAAVAGPDRPKRTHLQAAYFDTAERTLARAGMALRVRREGRRWVQTLKGAGSDGMTRAEHNVALPPTMPARVAEAEPAADPSLHAGTAIGERLVALLAPAGGAAALVCQYRTDIWRRTLRVDASAGRVELAFDEGVIVAGERRVPVCELEVEALDGSAQAVIDTAAALQRSHGLWLDSRSKAERGDLLARGEAMAPALKADGIVVPADATFAAVRQVALASSVRQIVANASQVASGEFLPAHLHQLRVGLRRLRSALQFFRGSAADDGDGALAAAAAALFRQLGGARDRDAVLLPLAQVLSTQCRVLGLDAALAPGTPVGGAPAAPSDPAPAAPAACVQGAAAQALLLDLLALLQRGSPPAQGSGDAVAARPAAPQAAREQAAAVFRRWHRQIARAAKSGAALDEEQRHALRKRVKRLRYAVEFAGALFPRKRVARFLVALRAAQERLGEVNDTAVAIAAHRQHLATDPRALFALGWLAAQQQHGVAASAPALAALSKAERFWRGDGKRR